MNGTFDSTEGNLGEGMQPLHEESPNEIVTRLRLNREQEATMTRAEVVRWLTAAEIAIVAVLEAASAGNTTCKTAAREILPLISKSL